MCTVTTIECGTKVVIKALKTGAVNSIIVMYIFGSAIIRTRTKITIGHL